MAVYRLVVLSPSFPERGCDPGGLWVEAGISYSQFQWEGSWAPLVPPRAWLPSFGEVAIGLGQTEKRKSVVCPWDGLAPVRVSGRQNRGELEAEVESLGPWPTRCPSCGVPTPTPSSVCFWKLSSPPIPI